MSSDCGTVRPSASAVLRLMISSTFLGCSTARSASLAPLRIWLALTALQPCLKNHVEWGLGSSSHLGKATFGNDFAQFGFSSLCPKSCTNFLRKRRRYAYHRRSRVIQTPDRV